MASTTPGFTGKLLRVDLTNEEVHEESIDEATQRAYPGGTSIGAKVLYEEVPPGVEWSDPENRLVLATGPLGGTTIGGSGSFSVVTKGALTNGATSSQANGFLGAYLKFCGYDGIIIQGAAKRWLYLHVRDGGAELRDASHLAGKDTWETDDTIKRELGYKEKAMSVFCIGPAGENLVRFAAICGDKGHVAGHNGTGAVMGSKRLKAIAVDRGKQRLAVSDRKGLVAVSKELMEFIKGSFASLDLYNWGTLQGVTRANAGGWLPIKNYTTNVYPISTAELEMYGAEYIRGNFAPKKNPCWACQLHHCHLMRVARGPYAGEIVEEPEYEGFAAWGPTTGQTDVAATMVISNDVDRLGFDTNEAGWVVGMVMECYEKGLLTLEDTDGLDMRWGNADATRAILRRIAHRQGFGDILADGVMRAAARLGGEVPNMAVHTMKGNSPRGHDHRTRWSEMFDTCVSNTGTIETSAVDRQEFGLPSTDELFSPEDVVAITAKPKGSMQFEDSLGVCRFNTRTNMKLLVAAVRAATGWDLTFEEAMETGRRTVNLMRAFNLRHGIGADQDRPSPRYGSTPVDGPAKGVSILPHWDKMVHDYYEQMGWDVESGKPLPETLQRLGLGHTVADIWR